MKAMRYTYAYSFRTSELLFPRKRTQTLMVFIPVLMVGTDAANKWTSSQPCKDGIHRRDADHRQLSLLPSAHPQFQFLKLVAARFRPLLSLGPSAFGRASSQQTFWVSLFWSLQAKRPPTNPTRHQNGSGRYRCLPCLLDHACRATPTNSGYCTWYLGRGSIPREYI